MLRHLNRRKRRMGTTTTTLSRVPLQSYLYGFIHDETTGGRRLKCLTVLEEYTRESLAIHWALSITAADVMGVLHQ